jgi:formylglycine-generating enzyme required for sulfatase activity
MSPGWLRIVSLAAALAAAALPAWPLSAADATDDAEVDLTVSDGGSSFTNSIGMKLVRVPKGKFLMGSPKNDPEAGSGEQPQHEVELTKDFFLGVHEVTQKQYKQVLGSNPAFFSKDGGGRNQVQGMNTDDFPVEQIAWNDTQKFLEKLNALSAEAGRRRPC